MDKVAAVLRHAKYFINLLFLLVEFTELKLASMPTQTQRMHGHHMDVLKTVGNINISIKH